jgi:hypothetical protein
LCDHYRLFARPDDALAASEGKKFGMKSKSKEGKGKAKATSFQINQPALSNSPIFESDKEEEEEETGCPKIFAS